MKKTIKKIKFSKNNHENMVRELFKEEIYMLKGVLLGVLIGITGGFFSSTFLQILVLSDLDLATWWFIFLVSLLIFLFVIMITYAYIRTLEVIGTGAEKIIKKIVDEKFGKNL